MSTVLFGEMTELAYRPAASGTGAFTPVGNRVSLNGPNPTRGSVETTVMGSPTDVTIPKLFRPSNLVDAGELSLTVYYNPSDATHITLTGMLAAGAADALQDWQVTYSDDSAFTCEGFVTGFNVTGASMDSNVSAELTIKLTGVAVWN